MKLTIIFLAALIVAGCSAWVPFYFKNYEPNMLISTTVGNPMMSWSNGMRELKSEAVNGMTDELIYAGIDGDVVQVKYREYSIARTGEYAREAFYLDLVRKVRA